MQVRGFRRRRAADRGFVISDHVDWPDLLRTIRESACEHVIATHGYTASLVRYLTETGTHATAYATRFTDSSDADADDETTGGAQITAAAEPDLLAGENDG
jgi:putative mRNA 3-end processing factor